MPSIVPIAFHVDRAIVTTLAVAGVAAIMLPVGHMLFLRQL
jgi:hypothetical protein